VTHPPWCSPAHCSADPAATAGGHLASASGQPAGASGQLAGGASGSGQLAGAGGHHAGTSGQLAGAGGEHRSAPAPLTESAVTLLTGSEMASTLWPVAGGELTACLSRSVSPGHCTTYLRVNLGADGWLVIPVEAARGMLAQLERLLSTTDGRHSTEIRPGGEGRDGADGRDGAEGRHGWAATATATAGEGGHALPRERCG
jgi:hypothetical protein